MLAICHCSRDYLQQCGFDDLVLKLCCGIFCICLYIYIMTLKHCSNDLIPIIIL